MSQEILQDLEDLQGALDVIERLNLDLLGLGIGPLDDAERELLNATLTSLDDALDRARDQLDATREALTLDDLENDGEDEEDDEEAADV